jgi:hypothetical protein
MMASKEVLMAEFKIQRGRRWTPEQARAVLDEIDRRGVPVSRFSVSGQRTASFPPVRFRG